MSLERWKQGSFLISSCSFYLLPMTEEIDSQATPSHPAPATTPAYPPPPVASEPNFRGDQAGLSSSKSSENGRESTVYLSGRSTPRPRWIGATVLIQLFRLSTRFIPIAGVLVGGYYGYSYFFGPVSVIEEAAASLGVAELSPKQESKVNQMLQQTRDAVAASDARVHAANALADVAISGVMDGAESVLSEGVKLVADPGAETVAAKPVAILDQFASFEAERAATEADAPVATSTFTFAQTGVESEVVSEVEPTNGFLLWIQQANIGGVRKGSAPKALINGITLKVGSKADHHLGITFEGLTEDGQALVFRDQTNAVVTKPF